jgi:hypothetical protein
MNSRRSFSVIKPNTHASPLFIFQSRPTHHLVTFNAGGDILINKADYQLGKDVGKVCGASQPSWSPMAFSPPTAKMWPTPHVHFAFGPLRRLRSSPRRTCPQSGLCASRSRSPTSRPHPNLQPRRPQSSRLRSKRRRPHLSRRGRPSLLRYSPRPPRHRQTPA